MAQLLTFIWAALAIALFLGAALALRLLFVVPALRRLINLKDPKPRRRKARETVKVAVFLGSGGHTAEMLKLVSALDPSRYTERVYYVSHGDQFSARKAAELELDIYRKRLETSASAQLIDKPHPLTIKELPRARKVHQSASSTPLSAAVCLLVSVHHVVLQPMFDRPQPARKGAPRQAVRHDTFADLLLLNGPGTCVPLVLAVYVRRILGLRSPHIMYVESFARVQSLSLSAKLLQGLVDTFVVQWPEASPKAVCQGWLV
ncbi:UDP-N-acetylglucosamine transferase subunit [Tilletia horrida]|uniref:UDP-N-acetylglucosamine transferase subunit ALG14 n=1 Tax=Tilletia horrida TaxID=155126 RepID=A0AAN6G556_9BASI|nr:UDP-N-acetylglucosamine transferase subunit [Tilletia horrida]